ncbi:hypothetical protein [Bernardetia sp.]|uniref:hypothetical protein n=1 Tax=Bernardetia sp. TaxID=1937974 RepID=UPI0025C45A20|nr:hypothetical protein [Bernardetia sp.]
MSKHDAHFLSKTFQIENLKEMKDFKQHKSILLKKIEDAGEFGYALFSDEIVSLLKKHIDESELPKRPTDGLIEFASNLHIHGVPVNERNAMVKTILERYYESLFPIKSN